MIYDSCHKLKNREELSHSLGFFINSENFSKNCFKENLKIKKFSFEIICHIPKNLLKIDKVEYFIENCHYSEEKTVFPSKNIKNKTYFELDLNNDGCIEISNSFQKKLIYFHESLSQNQIPSIIGMVLFKNNP